MKNKLYLHLLSDCKNTASQLSYLNLLSLRNTNSFKLYNKPSHLKKTTNKMASNTLEVGINKALIVTME